jgi:hypothetical protein
VTRNFHLSYPNRLSYAKIRKRRRNGTTTENEITINILSKMLPPLHKCICNWSYFVWFLVRNRAFVGCPPHLSHFSKRSDIFSHKQTITICHLYKHRFLLLSFKFILSIILDRTLITCRTFSKFSFSQKYWREILNYHPMEKSNPARS